MYGTPEDGISKLSSLQSYLEGSNVTLNIEDVNGIYSKSILIFNDVLAILEKLEGNGAPSFYATDFTHTFSRFSSGGHIWAIVCPDPDGSE
jgi:hypothetical protein